MPSCLKRPQAILSKRINTSADTQELLVLTKPCDAKTATDWALSTPASAGNSDRDADKFEYIQSQEVSDESGMQAINKLLLLMQVGADTTWCDLTLHLLGLADPAETHPFPWRAQSAGPPPHLPGTPCLVSEPPPCLLGTSPAYAQLIRMTPPKGLPSLWYKLLAVRL